MIPSKFAKWILVDGLENSESFCRQPPQGEIGLVPSVTIQISTISISPSEIIAANAPASAQVPSELAEFSTLHPE